jgi:quercetin dioxygenase-like cupin family protein
MMDQNFEAFKARKSKEGFNEILERVWEPNFSNETHDHPFDVDALVAQGEFWLTMNGSTAHFKTGDRFLIPRGAVHSERYGADGAVFWAARKT